MTTTCKIEAEILVDGKVMRSKVWPCVDIMKTGATRGWTTRQFNYFLKDLNACRIGKDKIISARWAAQYGEAQGYSKLTGSLSGVNGKVMAKRGIFE